MCIRTLLVLFSCLFSFLLVPSSYAHVERLARFAPPPRCAAVPPPGCRNCFLIAPTYNCGVWADQHFECYYANNPDVWVGAHWECTRYYPVTGVCGAWRWVPSYWLRTPVVVTRPVMVVQNPVIIAPPAPPPPLVVMAPPPVIVGPPPVFFNIGNGCRRHHHCW